MLIRAKMAGFSFIELLLVLVILGMAAAFTIPSLRGTMDGYRLNTSVDIIVGELDAARVMAISRGTRYEVRFTSGTVSVVDPQDTNRPPRTPKDLEQGVYVGSSQTLTFNPRGTCNGGAIRLDGTSGVKLISVTKTGKITVSNAASTTGS